MKILPDIEDRYNELDNLEDGLISLVAETNDSHYKEIFLETIREIRAEKEELEPRLKEIKNKEDREMNYQYERSRL